MSTIDAKRWIKARANTTWHVSQIQGFFYGTADDGGYHVIRDCTKNSGQEIWSKLSTGAEYRDTHAAMMAEIDLVKTKIICAAYDVLNCEASE